MHVTSATAICSGSSAAMKCSPATRSNPSAPDAGRDHGQSGGHRFQDLQPRPAADPQRDDHDRARRQEWSDIGDVGVQFDARDFPDLLDECLRRLAADQAQSGRGLRGPHGREDPVQQQSDRVEIRPPIEAAQEEDRPGLRVRLHRLEVSPVDAVVHHVHVPAAELIPDQARVVLAHGHHPGRRIERAALEALEFPPLLLDVPALEGIGLRLEVALPDQRFYIVGDHDLGAALDVVQGINEDDRFDLPEVDSDARERET